MKIQFKYWIFCSYLFLVFICLTKNVKAAEDESEDSMEKNARFLSMFEIINFPNDACTGDSKNGTCYTSQECDNKGGTKDGTCASSYGVCCVFDVKCGTMSSENNTYFTNSGSETAGTCSIQVCPGENICQLRLDFDSFVINGPYTNTITTDMVTQMLWGVIPGGTYAVAGEDVLMSNSQCTIDSFSVTSPSGVSPPVICGTNNGEHMYVEATPSYCNTLGFSLGSTSAVSRSWSVRVSQFECDYNNLAPQGCTQYFFGQSSGTFRSYNYQSGKGYNLANQNQNICFRREKGNTKVCYSTQTFTDFQVSYNMASPEKGMVGLDKTCCGYGDDGKKPGYDCLMVPSALNAAATRPIGIAAMISKQVEGAFCGNGGLLSENDKLAADSKTICSKRAPFMVRFITDSFELKDEGNKQMGTKGFELAYILS